ncbi:MAG: sodium:solute symporter [Phycisphaerae bacterium]|nr:sodium:solute symporter [Phycisphaerae bacterium]
MTPVLALGDIQIARLDVIVIVIYFVGIVGIGLWAGMKRKSHADSDTYFRAGGTLTWPIIGMALFSTNISTIHMVGFAGEGYRTGLTYGNFEWMAPFLLIVLALFFAPFYLKSRIATLPDFLEKRYCSTCRNWLAGLSIVSAVFIHIGFTLYTGALVIKTLFGVPIMASIVAAAVLTGIYTVIGGLLAVVVTGALQTVILLAGSIILTVVAYTKIGGWDGLTQYVEPAKLTILRPSSDPANLPWYSVFLGYPIIGLWYWCADQTIVQRVLGAKDSNHARIGPLFAGFLKVLPVFIFFMPGLIYLAMVNRGDFPALGSPDECFSLAIQNLLPPGVTGLMAAALLAALMSTVSGALNSIATLVSYDLYKQWKPETSDRKLIGVGQIATVVCMVIAIFWSKYIGRFSSVYQGCVDLICYVAPPITTVFLFGVFWKRASNKAALWTMAMGSLMGLAVFVIDWNDYFNWSMPGLLAGFYLFCACSVIMVVTSLIQPHQHTEESAKLVWDNPLAALKDKGWPGLANYKFLCAALFVTMVVCYLSFLNPKAMPAANTGDTRAGLIRAVYNDRVTVENEEGIQEDRIIRDLYPLLSASHEVTPVASSVVDDLDTPEGLELNRVYAYQGYFEAMHEGLYQFEVVSPQKLDVRVGHVTLSLYDTTSGTDKDTKLERTYIGQIHLKQGKHVFATYFYPSVPWKPFALKDALGLDNDKEVERQAAWEAQSPVFQIGYMAPEQAEVRAIPADALSYEP